MEKIYNKMTPKNKYFFKMIGVYLLTILLLFLLGIVLCRVSYRKAEKLFEARYEALKIELEQQKAEEMASYAEQVKETDPKTKKAQLIAKVLYGVKDNSSDDLRTLCWCIFNRIDNAQFPGTLEEVVAQPNQWMGYSENNIVLEELYQIAMEELTRWISGEKRPCDTSYVFMDWNPQEISLRNEYKTTPSTRYWRYK